MKYEVCNNKLSIQIQEKPCLIVSSSFITLGTEGSWVHCIVGYIISWSRLRLQMQMCIQCIHIYCLLFLFIYFFIPPACHSCSQDDIPHRTQGWWWKCYFQGLFGCARCTHGLLGICSDSLGWWKHQWARRVPHHNLQEVTVSYFDFFFPCF